MHVEVGMVMVREFFDAISFDNMTVRNTIYFFIKL